MGHANALQPVHAGAAAEGSSVRSNFPVAGTWAKISNEGARTRRRIWMLNFRRPTFPVLKNGSGVRTELERMDLLNYVEVDVLREGAGMECCLDFFQLAVVEPDAPALRATIHDRSEERRV